MSLYSNSPAPILFWTLCQKARSLSLWELCKTDICLLPHVRQVWGGRRCSIGLCVACAAFICNVTRGGPSLTFLTAWEGLACWGGRPSPDGSGPRQRSHGESICTAHSTCHLASSHPSPIHHCCCNEHPKKKSPLCTVWYFWCVCMTLFTYPAPSFPFAHGAFWSVSLSRISSPVRSFHYWFMEATAAGRQGSDLSACQQHGASVRTLEWVLASIHYGRKCTEGVFILLSVPGSTQQGGKSRTRCWRYVFAVLSVSEHRSFHHSCAGGLKWDLHLYPSKDLNLCISSLLTHYSRELAQEDRTGLDRNELPLRQVLSKLQCPNSSLAVPRNRNNLTLKKKLCSDPCPIYQRTMTNLIIFILRPE